jgi:hypothetical protein
MMQLVARTSTLMSINNRLLTKVPAWQGLSGRNRLKSYRSHRIRRKRWPLNSNDPIETAPTIRTCYPRTSASGQSR